MRETARQLLWMMLLLGTACATPRLQLADPATLLKGDLTFLQDGKTTREEVLVRLGAPSGRFEGDRILTFPLVADSQGEWHVGSLPPAAPGAFRAWPSGTGSLVLVFDVDGVLARHSLVVPR